MSDKDSIFEPAIEKKVEITYDSLPNSSFEDVNLGAAKFVNVNLKEAHFDDVNMDKVLFNNIRQVYRHLHGKLQLFGRKPHRLALWLLYHEQR